MFVGMLCAAVSLFGAAVETRTFKLTYASAAEVAERLNGQMCRELGPDGKPFRVATAYEEANAVGAPAGAMNVVNGYPRGFNETNEPDKESIK